MQASGPSGGVVTLGTNITAGNITFNSLGYVLGGYSVTGSSVVTPPGGPYTLSMNTGGVITANADASINSGISGGGFTKAGSANLSIISNKNTFSGNVTVTGGSLLVTGDSSLAQRLIRSSSMAAGSPSLTTPRSSTPSTPPPTAARCVSSRAKPSTTSAAG